MGEEVDITLFAISIAGPVEMGLELSPELSATVSEVARRVREEAARPVG